MLQKICSICRTARFGFASFTAVCAFNELAFGDANRWGWSHNWVLIGAVYVGLTGLALGLMAKRGAR
jgi:hypothetical protein